MNFLINPYTYAQAGASGFATYDNHSPDGMYSLLQVSPVRTTVVRLINSVNTEQDFTPAELQDGTFATFANGALVRVHTLYDQSGNGYDIVSQGATPLPEISNSSGVLNTDVSTGMVYFTFPASSIFYSGATNGGADLNEFSIINLFSPPSTNAERQVGVGEEASGSSAAMDNNYNIRCNGSAVIKDSGTSNSANHITSLFWDANQNINGGFAARVDQSSTVTAWKEPSVDLTIGDRFGKIENALQSSGQKNYGFIVFKSNKFTQAQTVEDDWLADHPDFAF